MQGNAKTNCHLMLVRISAPTLLARLLFASCTTALAFSTSFGQYPTRAVGEMNGHEWRAHTTTAIKRFANVNIPEKESWVRFDAFMAKVNYLMGVYALASVLPTDKYEAITDEVGRLEFAPAGHPFPYTGGTTMLQMLEILDQFYDDSRNLNVAILDAMKIAHMEINGETHETVDWWTRYFRSDESRRGQMLKEEKK